MTQPYQILNSKITAPGAVDIVFRKGLIPHFDAIASHKITSIIAGAGFGKSTLVAQACDYLGVQKSWYRLEKSDCDFVTFFNYIIAGIKKKYPEFGTKTLKRLVNSGSLSEISHTALSVFVNEAEHFITGDYVIVLDDCHEVAESREINEALLFLFEHLPDNVHIVMMSRISLTLPLSKFKARRAVYEIRQTDLEFSVNEITQLYMQLFGFAVPEKSLRHLHTKTEGWVSGLILFYHLSRDKKPDEIENLLVEIKSNHKIFREYMGENVYVLQTSEVRNFLIRTSVLNTIETDISNRLLGMDHSGEILDELEKNHLFTTSVDDENRTYCYHHLFQEFLRNRLGLEKGQNEERKMHRRAAGIYEEDHRYEDALNHYLDAEMYDDVFRLLSITGKIFIMQGRHRALDAILKRIPEKHNLTEPWLLLQKARMCSSDGNLKAAAEYSLKAHEVFRKRGINEGIELNLMELGRIYYLMGDFVKAEQTFDAVLKSGNTNPQLKLEILGHLIFISGFTGHIEQSDQYFQEAESLLANAQNTEFFTELKIWIMLSYGYSCQFRGEAKTAIEYCDSVYDEIESHGLWQAMAYYCQITSLCHMFLGEMDTAQAKVMKGLAILAEKGFQRTQEAWLRLFLGMSYLSLEKVDRAERELEKGIELFRKGGSRWGEGSCLVIFTILYSQKGDLQKAAQSLSEGLEIAKEMDLRWVEGKLLSMIALKFIGEGRFEEAHFFLQNAENLIAYSQFETCLLKIIRSRYYSGCKQPGLAVDTLVDALVLSKQKAYGAWIFFKFENIVQELVLVYASGKMKDYIIWLFVDYGWKFIDHLAVLEKSRNKGIRKAAGEIISKLPREEIPSLRVYCLGRLRVFAGDYEIDSSKWKSRKAMDIFKYLLMSRNKRPVNKEELLELIWPEEDSEKTLKRLHVALPALRKTLEPDVRRGESSYLVREKDSYHLDLGIDGFVDFEIFLQEFEKAGKEKDPEKEFKYLLKAESCYGGELFTDDLYAEWCFEERERINRVYLSVLDKIISYYDRANEYAKCIEYANKYISADIFAEDIYRKLMHFYFKTGNNSMVKKTYEKCLKNIQEDLNCPLSKETTDLYNELVVPYNR